MPAAETPDRALTGLALRLFAIFCLASMAALIKLAEAHGASLVEILFHRQLWAVPVVMAWLAAGDGLGTIRTKRFGAHVGRTAIGLTGMVFNFGAILLLPLAEATTLSCRSSRRSWGRSPCANRSAGTAGRRWPRGSRAC